MKFAVLSLVVLVGFAMAQDPTEILIKYDIYNGYGEALTDAIASLWPSCNMTGCLGQTWPQFITALDTGAWDMVIIEAHNYRGDTSNYNALVTWYQANEIPVFFADWSMSNPSYGLIFAQELGAVSVANGGGVVPHYTWDAGHPITDGISDWTFNDPSYGTTYNMINVGSRAPYPVTGWTASSSPGMAGICVCDDGFSVLSGYFPSLANDGQNIWENILDFMWNGVGLTPSTWGHIKAEFAQ